MDLGRAAPATAYGRGGVPSQIQGCAGAGQAMIEILDIAQGSDAWRGLRLGMPTASRFADILAQGKGLTRRKYLYELAGEIMTGETNETFNSMHMERGKLME